MEYGEYPSYRCHSRRGARLSPATVGVHAYIDILRDLRQKRFKR